MYSAWLVQLEKHKFDLRQLNQTPRNILLLLSKLSIRPEILLDMRNNQEHINFGHVLSSFIYKKTTE